MAPYFSNFPNQIRPNSTPNPLNFRKIRGGEEFHTESPEFPENQGRNFQKIRGGEKCAESASLEQYQHLGLRSWPPFTGVPRGAGWKAPHGVPLLSAFGHLARSAALLTPTNSHIGLIHPLHLEGYFLGVGGVGVYKIRPCTKYYPIS